LLRTISLCDSVAVVFGAARIACSIEVALYGDFLHADRVKNGHLEGETTHAMSPDQFRREYEELAADTSLLEKCASRCGPDAKDVVQGVMQRLWQLPPRKIQALRDLKAYAITAVRNAAVDAMRRKRSIYLDATHPEVENEIHQSVEQFVRPKDPLELAEEEQRRALLREAVTRLSPLDRALVTDKLDGHSDETTATRQNITVHQVRGKFVRALERLSELIEEQSRRDKSGY
jgi:RNA polymerase sigma factor (sigma-70 family)